MLFFSILTTITLLALTASHPTNAPQHTFNPSTSLSLSSSGRNISHPFFASLEELARIVDISYCVGTTGISKPFECASRCHEFPNFELVDTFNTGPLMSDSCGYIVLDHGHKAVTDNRNGNGKKKKGNQERVIVAFRGTYSIANTIVDLSTVPQEYVPYPGESENGTSLEEGKGHHRSYLDLLPRPLRSWVRSKSSDSKNDENGNAKKDKDGRVGDKNCENCTVHMGFWSSWRHTRPLVVPRLQHLKEVYPGYKLHLVGHSLGGAVAVLAGLEFEALGWHPTITTFGEPRVGNAGLRNYIDDSFDLNSDTTEGEHHGNGGRYRRVTHVDDPVPLLPLQEWGYRPHAGEVYISKASLPPTISDFHLCEGDEDISCIAGAELDEASMNADTASSDFTEGRKGEEMKVEGEIRERWGVPIPARYKMWQLFFAHRDYFWRLGLCVPGGDPLDWGRGYPNITAPEDGGEREEL